MTNLMVAIVVLVFIAGIILLQLYLSKKESRWAGLVLPILAFLFSLLYPLNMVSPIEGISAGFIIQMLLIWLLGNIPTAVLLIIYFVCRGKIRRNKQLDKMNIQDLG